VLSLPILVAVRDFGQKNEFQPRWLSAGGVRKTAMGGIFIPSPKIGHSGWQNPIDMRLVVEKQVLKTATLNTLI